MSDVLTLARAQAQIETDLSDDDLQNLIDDEEAWLARRIGALSGERSETFYVYGVDQPLPLRRPTDAATVTDNGSAATIVLLNDGWDVESTAGAWTGPVVVTYTPNDEAEVRRVLLELVRLTLTETAYQSENIGDYSYNRGSIPTRRARYALARSLQREPHNGSLRLTSSIYAPRRVTQVAS